MGQYGIVTPVGPFSVASAVYDTFTAKQNVSPFPLPVIDANTMSRAKRLRVAARGRFNTTGTPNLTMGLYFGTAAGVITVDIALSSIIVAPTATMWPWRMFWEGNVLTEGAACTVEGGGELQLGSALTTYADSVPIPITDALTVVAVDASISRAVGVSATWGTSSASNRIETHFCNVEILN